MAVPTVGATAKSLRTRSHEAPHARLTRLQTSLSLAFDYERPIAILNALVGQFQPQFPISKERR